MPVQLVPAVGFILAAIATGLAVYYWRRSASLYALLVEGANRFEELRQLNGSLEQAQHKNAEKLRHQQQTLMALEKATDEARTKAAEMVRRVEGKEHELHVTSSKLELQKGHLEKELLKAQTQLQAADDQRLAEAAQRTADAARHQQELRAWAQKYTALEHHAQLKEQEWSLQLQEAAQIAALKAKTTTADPLELRRLRRKIAQYDRLYSGMKGLREMAEERNHNWEVALRKLATWIVQQRHPQRILPPTIGPLVGQAMQIIGAQLIDDDLMAPAAGASRGDLMAAQGEAELALDDDGSDLDERPLLDDTESARGGTRGPAPKA